MKKTNVEYYKDGSIKAIGKLKNGKRDGYWKWYRNDGSKLKTGYFIEGKRVKEWMRYNTNGKLIIK